MIALIEHDEQLHLATVGTMDLYLLVVSGVSTKEDSALSTLWREEKTLRQPLRSQMNPRYHPHLRICTNTTQ